VKLTNVDSGFKLHSQDLQYATGSGQQTVTAIGEAADPNSYFLVKPAYGSVEGSDEFARGKPVKCDSIIRLQHLQTNKFLHSHIHDSPLSRNQEVSGFGEENGGDNWKVVCVGGGGKDSSGFWLRDERVKLVHDETGFFLQALKRHAFGKPIQGQIEVSAAAKGVGSSALWTAMEGIYFSDNPLHS
jgi:dolichyl-phosphate-mannose--protein O-mannosyl transferase